MSQVTSSSLHRLQVSGVLNTHLALRFLHLVHAVRSRRTLGASYIPRFPFRSEEPGTVLLSHDIRRLAYLPPLGRVAPLLCNRSSPKRKPQYRICKQDNSLRLKRDSTLTNRRGKGDCEMVKMMGTGDRSSCLSLTFRLFWCP